MTWQVLTDYPVALDSPDHLWPHGTARDNSRCPEFCELVERHFGGRPLFCLDLGCSGGGLVRDWLERGHHALGLEGSDYSRKRGRAEWATIPENLLTCDCSRPFQVLYEGAPARFDVITGWEFFEHIPEDRIKTLMTNVRNHIAPGGLVLASIPCHRDPPWHLCLHERPWWNQVFANHGFEVSEEGLDILRQHRVREGFETAFAFRPI